MPRREKVAVEVFHAIACDDIRTEDNGKRILIGVYAHSILWPKPTQAPDGGQVLQLMKVAYLLECVVNKMGAHILEFEFSPPNGPKNSFIGQISIADPSEIGLLFHVPIPGLPFNVTNEGDVVFRYRIQGDKRWKIASRVKLQFK